MKKPFFILGILLIALSFNQSQAQWKQTSGPFRGTSMYLAAGNGAVFSGYSKIYRSTDNGMSWLEKSDGIWQYLVSALYVSGNRVLAGFYDNGNPYLYFSDDNGDNWTQLNSVTNTSTITGFTKLGSNLFFSTYETYQNGVFISTDNGMSWTKTAGIGLTNTITRCIVTMGNYLFLGTSDGIFRSSDNGTNWQAFNNAGQNTDVNSMTVKNNDLYVAFGAGANYSSSIYKSTDFGASFTYSGSSPAIPYSRNIYSDGTNIYLSTDDGLFRSTDDGTNWSRIALKGAMTYSTIVSGGNIILGTSFLGTYTSTDNGVGWTNTGIENTCIVQALASIDNILITGNNSQDGLFISRNNGNSFTEYANPSSSNVNCIVVRGTDVFAGTQHSTTGGVYKSGDLGYTWNAIGLKNEDVFAIAFRGNYLFAGSFSDGVFRTTNDGITWNQSNTGIQGLWIKSLVLIDTILYAGTNSGVYVSTNNGSSWVLTGLQNISVNELAVIGSSLYAGTDNGVYFYQSAGNWVQAGLPSQIISVLKSRNADLFAGYQSSILVSTNSGIDWTTKGEGLSSSNYIADFAFNSSYGFVGTWSGGLWRRPISEITGVGKDQNGIPSNYSLDQNYPNPFNPNTVISYQIPSNSHVTLKVYNILGKEVATLVNENQAAGQYNFNFKAGNLSSGVYIYQLTAGSFKATKKLTLLK